MKVLFARDVCACLSSKKKKFTYSTLNNWVRRGVITPVHEAEGTGHHRLFSLVDVLAIAAGLGLTSNGYSSKIAREVTVIIQSMTEEELEANFAKGNTCLMLVGKVKAAPVLMAEESIVSNPKYIDYASAEQYGLTPTALNVKRLYDNIVSRIGKVEAEQRKPAKKK